MSAYYNEHDPKAAAWLRELIARNLIAPGDVDGRSVLDVRPDDIAHYTQCHFFAGVGVWSYALRQAGWPDDRPVWTGSCPCQPFSAAGKGGGFADERHLWPAWHWLISQRKPGVVFGEQVASRDGLAWLDLVRTDMEAEGYAIGALDLCAAGFGAPHIRQRLYFVADAERRPAERHGRALGGTAGRDEGAGTEWERLRDDAGDGVNAGELADAASEQRGAGRLGAAGDEPGAVERSTRLRAFGGVADADRSAGDKRADEPERGAQGRTSDGRDGAAVARRPGPTNGFWRNADWIRCRDGRWRPVEPGSTPLVAGASARMGRLRGYGNAINAETARHFIAAYMEVKA